MKIAEIFSIRQKKARGEAPDVYKYDTFPEELRVQLTYIWMEAIGDLRNSDPYSREYKNAYDSYKVIVDIIKEEYGVYNLTNIQTNNPQHELFDFFITTSSFDKAMDVVELCTKLIAADEHTHSMRTTDGTSVNNKQYIDKTNYRFKEAGVGYEFISGIMIRIDSNLIHNNVVKQALLLLYSEEYIGAEKEFLSAHDHFNKGKNKEALTDCLKSFESLMKVICDKRGWAYSPHDTAKRLIEIMFSKGLIPTFWQTQFTSLRSLLESSVPTGRNRLAAHGQGGQPIDVPDYLAAYMLHMTASTLVFLAKAEENMP